MWISLVWAPTKKVLKAVPTEVVWHAITSEAWFLEAQPAEKLAEPFEKP